jgi:glycosyltransferase involved in cell wall biosynthesis
MCEDITILLATYNGAKYIKELIESIQRQNVTNWKLLVSDDCSTDNTVSIIQKEIEKDKRIKIISKGSKFGSAKLNFFNLMSVATGKYFLFCDQDDVWYPDKIEKLIREIKQIENEYGNIPSLVFSDSKVVDERLNVISESFERYQKYDPYDIDFGSLLSLNVAAGCTMAFNVRLLHQALKLESFEHVMMHDWWMMLVAKAFGEIRYLDTALVKYRQHGDNEVGASGYSPVARARAKSFMQQQMIASCQQAGMFMRTYGDEASAEYIVQAETYSRVASQRSTIEAVKLLVRSGGCKKGIRFVGQLATIYDICKANRLAGR